MIFVSGSVEASGSQCEVESYLLLCARKPLHCLAWTTSFMVCHKVCTKYMLLSLLPLT